MEIFSFNLNEVGIMPYRVYLDILRTSFIERRISQF